MKVNQNIVMLGIGNVGRQDDGLGWKFLEKIKNSKCFRGEAHYRYQLNVEDADVIKDADRVFVVDAYKGQLENGFIVEPCKPDGSFEFTSHALQPEAVLALCQKLYKKHPKMCKVKIQGFEWELKEGLTEQAQQNLTKAIEFFGALEEMECVENLEVCS